jgi:hypothetical protein
MLNISSRKPKILEIGYDVLFNGLTPDPIQDS